MNIYLRLILSVPPTNKLKGTSRKKATTIRGHCRSHGTHSTGAAAKSHGGATLGSARSTSSARTRVEVLQAPSSDDGSGHPRGQGRDIFPPNKAYSKWSSKVRFMGFGDGHPCGHASVSSAGSGQAIGSCTENNSNWRVCKREEEEEERDEGE